MQHHHQFPIKCAVSIEYQRAMEALFMHYFTRPLLDYRPSSSTTTTTIGNVINCNNVNYHHMNNFIANNNNNGSVSYAPRIYHDMKSLPASNIRPSVINTTKYSWNFPLPTNIAPSSTIEHRCIKEKSKNTSDSTSGSKVVPSRKKPYIAKNLHGRTYSPGRPLSLSNRQQIIKLHENGMRVSQIAKVIGVTHSCVSKILSKFRLTGSIQPKLLIERRLTDQMSSLTFLIQDYHLRLQMNNSNDIQKKLIHEGICNHQTMPSHELIDIVLSTNLNK